MMETLVASVRWDWFKLSRRWIPWILLAILLVITQLIIWGNFATYQSIQSSGGIVTGGPASSRGRPVQVKCSDLLAGNTSTLPPNTSPQVVQGLTAECQQNQAQFQHQLAQEYDTFTLPGSIPAVLSVGLTIGLILLAILTASHFGTEYGWGTIRPTLVRGIQRWQYVAAKLILLALLAAGALLVVIAVAAISSTVAAGLASQPAGLISTATWGHAFAVFGKDLLALVAYLIFVAFFTVLTRSSAAGIAIGIAYRIAEQILVGILSAAFDWFSSVAHYLLGQNIDAWSGASFFGPSQSSVSSLHALLVLLAYAVVLGGATFYLFQERDIAGAAGG